ncbi:MAG: hypothetical protein BWK77_01965, partial [Verrucomicrobia bacterium A1]
MFLGLVAVYAVAATVVIAVRHRPEIFPKPHGTGSAPVRESPMAGSAGEPRTVAHVLRGEADAVRDAIREADRMSDRGLAGQALQRLQQRQAAFPDNLALRLRIAGTQLSLGDAASARDGFVAAIRIDPANVDAREGLAGALLALKDAEGALEMAQWAIEGGKAEAGSLRVAARAAVDLGQYTVAAGHLQDWLGERPDEVEARDLLGLCHLRLGEYGKAAFQLGDLIRQGRGTEASYLNLTLAFAQQKQSADVAGLLLKAAQRLNRPRVLAWFGRPDFAEIREDPVVAAIAAQLAEGSSPGPTLKLPEATRESISPRALGMT